MKKIIILVILLFSIFETHAQNGAFKVWISNGRIFIKENLSTRPIEDYSTNNTSILEYKIDPNKLQITANNVLLMSLYPDKFLDSTGVVYGTTVLLALQNFNIKNRSGYITSSTTVKLSGGTISISNINLATKGRQDSIYAQNQTIISQNSILLRRLDSLKTIETARTKPSDYQKIDSLSSRNSTRLSNTSLPLPTGASTSALQTTTNTTLSSIDSKTPALGQALSTGSTPVVLTIAQIGALTPLSTVATITRTSGVSVSGTITTGGTAQQIVASNSNRMYLSIQNTSDNDIYISIGSVASVTNGYKLYSGFSYEPRVLPTGYISIFGATTGQTFTYLEQ